MPLIHIDNWPQPIESGRHRILEAALDAGIPFPHGCGAGECGNCKCRLLEGQVSFDRNSPEALTEEERACGLILACRSRPLTDVRVQWLSTVPPTTMVKVDTTVARVLRASRDVVVLRVTLGQGQAFDFRPGQFAKLRFGKLPARSYSMANQSGEGRLDFHIRVLPDGKVSIPLSRDLRVGDTVEVRGPFGDACWDGAQAAHLLLLAGGTGLAPMLSVLDAALRGGQPAQQIHLYHGVRTEQDLYARDLLEMRVREYGIRFVPVFSEGVRKSQRNGHLHDALADDFADFRHAVIHMAGPPPMVDAVTSMVVARGARPAHIRADAFYAAAPEKRSLWERITAWGTVD